MGARLRSIASVLVGLVAVVGLLTSVVALWARDVLFDSAEVAAAAESALAEPEVTAALATMLTDLAFEAADVEARLTELAPADLEALVPALVGGAHTAVSDRLESAARGRHHASGRGGRGGAESCEPDAAPRR